MDFFLSKLELYYLYELWFIENRIFQTLIQFLQLRARHSQYKFPYRDRDIPPRVAQPHVRHASEYESRERYYIFLFMYHIYILTNNHEFSYVPNFILVRTLLKVVDRDEYP